MPTDRASDDITPVCRFAIYVVALAIAIPCAIGVLLFLGTAFETLVAWNAGELP